MTVIAKLSRPSVVRAYGRNRLFRRLDAARRRPVVWVGGVPGAGKTTLVSTYVEERKLASVWYHVDACDGEVPTFFSYLGLAVAGASARRRRSLPSLGPESLGALPAFARRFFRDLAERAGTPFVLVLDDYHEVSPDSALHGVLCEGLAELPPGLSAILVGRGEPPAAFARMRANGAMEVVSADELLLTPTEARGLVRSRAPGGRFSRAAASLSELSGGWAAGLVLMLEDARTSGSRLDRAGWTTPESVFDYFATEVLARMDGEARRVLLEASILPTVSSRLVERLTEVAGASRTLAQLARQAYFVVEHRGTVPVFQFHPLFRQFLRSRASERYDPEELDRLRCTAAALLLQEPGGVDAAVDLLLEARSWDAAASLIADSAAGVLAAGRAETLARWLLGLPTEVRRARPRLLYWLGMALLPHRPESARHHLEEAVVALQAQGDVDGLLLAWAGIVESHLVAWDDFSPLDRWIDLLVSLRRQLPAFPSEDIAARVSCAMYAALLYRRPDHPELNEWRKRAEQIALHHADPRLMTSAAYVIVQHAIFTGSVDAVRPIVERIRALTDSGLDPLTRIMWHGSIALFEWGTGSLEAATANATEGLRIAAETGIHSWDAILHISRAWSAIVAGRTQAAAEDLQAALHDEDPGRALVQTYGRFAQSILASLVRDGASAVAYAESALAAARRAGMPYGEAFSTFALGVALFRLGDSNRADERLGDARALAARLASPHVDYLAAIALARVAVSRGSEAEARVLLADALAVASHNGFFGLGAWLDPPERADLAALALAYGIEVRHVRETIRKTGLLPGDRALSVEGWPWRLRVWTLGRFEVWKDGAPIRFASASQRRPLELLRAIVAFGGSDVRQETLEEALWPDAEGDMAHHALESNLCRLRKILGDHDALKLRGGRIGLDSRTCFVDALAFERLASSALAALQAGREAGGTPREALALYQGPFLASDDSHWASPLRERLERKRRALAEKLPRAS